MTEEFKKILENIFTTLSGKRKKIVRTIYINKNNKEKIFTDFILEDVAGTPNLYGIKLIIDNSLPNEFGKLEFLDGHFEPIFFRSGE